MIIIIVLFVIASFFAGSLFGKAQRPDKNNQDATIFMGKHPPVKVPQKKFKILHIMSYHTDWEWTDMQFEGFCDALKPLDIEYKLVEMNAKSYSDKDSLEGAAERACTFINTWKPDLVYATDDEAQKYVTKRYANTTLPFVFSGVNMDLATYGLQNSKNVTGVLEIEHFVESIKLFKKIVPHAKKIAVVTDDAPMWTSMNERIKSKITDFGELEFILWDTLLTFEDYKKKVLEYQNIVDGIMMIGIFNFKDEEGENVNYQTVLEWTEKNSRLPDFSFWKDRVSYGTLCAVSVSGYKQGFFAGKMAWKILVDGMSPSDIPIGSTNKGEPVVSLARMKKLELPMQSKILLSSKVIKEFEWEK